MSKYLVETWTCCLGKVADLRTTSDKNLDWCMDGGHTLSPALTITWLLQTELLRPTLNPKTTFQHPQIHCPPNIFKNRCLPTQKHTIRTALRDTSAHKMSSTIPRFRAPQSLLCILLETRSLCLPYHHLTGDWLLSDSVNMQLSQSNANSLRSPCKLTTAVWRFAVCLSDSRV